MALRHLVLGLLTDRPDHAYALKARLAPGVPREQRVNDGVLYPLLAKLEAEGRVTGRDEPGRGDGLAASTPRRSRGPRSSCTGSGRTRTSPWRRCTSSTPTIRW
ncbi:PadR family transcriptional regulator [Prauserella oleivorans]